MYRITREEVFPFGLVEPTGH